MYKQNLKFHCGKVYGVISEYKQGCELLSYYIGGVLDKEVYRQQRISINGREISPELLKTMTWNIEPVYTRYEKCVVRPGIEKALRQSKVDDDFEAIADRFILTKERWMRQLRQ